MSFLEAFFEFLEYMILVAAVVIFGSILLHGSVF